MTAQSLLTEPPVRYASGEMILLVEDDEHDAFFMQRALRKARPDLSMRLASDGEQAPDYLNARGDFADRIANPPPSIIFLDLKLPYISGFQVLEHLRAARLPNPAPVFILTSSSEDRDRSRALELGAKGYFVKPPTPEMLLQVLGPSALHAHPP